MDFFQAYQLLWACRQARPIEAQHADLLGYLLMRCYAQGRLDTLTCTAPLEELVKALRQSERNVRRQRSYLRERGYLALSDQHHEVKLLLHELADELATPRGLLAAAPEPQAYPPVEILVLKEAVPPKALERAGRRTVASVMQAQGAPPVKVLVTGSGVKLSLLESNAAAAPLQVLDHNRFEAWLAEEAPKVLRFKYPITPHQLTDLFRKFDPKLIATKLRAIDNKTGAEKKYDHAYKTLVNWCKLGNFGRELDANDECPLPANQFLADEKRNMPAEMGSLFAQTGDAGVLPEYAVAAQEAAARNDKFNWNDN